MLKKIPSSYWIASIFTCILLIMSVSSPENFLEIVDSLNLSIFNIFGDFYLWFVFGTLILLLIIAISSLGRIKIGGKDAQIEHSFFSWFSMLFCAGMGIGLLFWGGAEPLYFFLNPPVEGTTSVESKELMAFQFAFFHWGLHPWAVYALTTLAICFFSMNLKRGIHFSTFFSKNTCYPEPLSLKRFLKSFVNNVTIIAILFGVVCSFGMGVVQVEGGLNNLFGIKQSGLVEVIIIIAITVCYMISTLRGLNNGIKVLSNVSMVLSFVLLGLLIIVLPLGETIKTMIQAVPAYIQNITDMSLGNYNYADEHFLREWTTKYWAWWIAWAPFVGIFVALISKGRTVRQLLLAMLFAPTLFSILWFTVFGKSAIILEQTQGFAGADLNFANINLILYKIVDGLFTSPLVGWLCFVLVFIFFVNSADSATYTLAAISQRGKNCVKINDNNDVEIKEPALFLQVCWGVTFSVLTGLFLFLGGMELLQQITLIMVLPFSMLLCFIFIKLTYDMVKYYRKEYKA